MKELSVIYNVSVSSEIIDGLASVGVREYTIVPRCHGRGGVTEPRMDDHVWPGLNSMLLAVVEDSLAAKAMGKLQELRDGNIGKAGLYAYVKSVESALVPPRG